MQSVLSLDLSCDPANLQIVEVSDRTLKVLEHQTVSLFSHSSSPLQEESQNGVPTTVGGAPHDGASIAESSASTDTSASTKTENFGPLRKAIESFSTPWTNAIVITQTPEYLSLNLELPFKDSKQIQKVLALEVQDRVPFEVDDLLLEHHIVGGYEDLGQDIHVGMLQRKYVQDILQLCKKNELEPLYLSTPMSALAAVHYIAPDYFAPNCAILYAHDPYLYITMCLDGVARSDRVIRRGELLRYTSDSVNAQDAIITDLKLTLTSFEQRYKHNLDKIYILGDGLDRSELQQGLGRNIETLPLSELVQSADDNAGLASLAAVFALDEQAPTLLSNFRVQEFAYSPKLREVLRGLRKVAPYLLTAFAAGMVALFGTYFARQHYVSGIRSQIIEEVVGIMPDAQNSPGMELDALRGEMTSLQEQLKNLGSLSRYSPLDAYLEITRDFPQGSGVTVRSINIKNNRIKVEGVAPDYAAVERIEKALKSKKKTYRNVKPEIQTNFNRGVGGLPFSMEIWLAES